MGFLFNRKKAVTEGEKGEKGEVLESKGLPIKGLGMGIKRIFVKDVGTEEFLEGLEELMLLNDVGIKSTEKIIKEAKARFGREGLLGEKRDMDAVKRGLKVVIANMLEGSCSNKGENAVFDTEEGGLKGDGLKVILVVGVNGVGKTSTIGKLSHYYVKRRKKVLLVGCDTFRAGAGEQLKVWGARAGALVYEGKRGEDAGGVLYDGLEAGKKAGVDIVIVDTAGRLHNKVNLVLEIEKLSRIIDKQAVGARRENLLVLDATTGQNGLEQAKVFKKSIKVSALVLTKYDSEAKGGLIIPLIYELGLRVKYLGYGEEVGDLKEFVTSEYIEGLLK